jgi:hypothetical protein
MNASFIICFHSLRVENLLQTLRFLIKNHSEVIPNSEIIIVCQDCLKSSKIQEIENLCNGFTSKRFIQMNLVEMQLPKITNFAVMSAKFEKIIILESDRILPKGYFLNVLNLLEPKILVSTKNMIKLQEECSDEQIEKEKYKGVEEFRSENNEIGMRNIWSGNTAVCRSDFIQAGMMDENYIGYGWADLDMLNKMSKIGAKSLFLEDLEIHLWHESATYGKLDQKELFINNGIRYCNKWNLLKPDWFLKDICEHRKNKLFF